MTQEKIQEKLDKGYILIRAVIEVIGRPKEHIIHAMKLVIKRLKEEENIILTKGDLYKAQEQDFEFKQKGKLWSTFAELELLLKDNDSVTYFCFEYLPASIEVLEPKNMRIPVKEYQNILNDLLARMHQIDMTLKNVRAENEILNKNASTLLRNIVLLTLSSGSKTEQELAKKVGTKDIKPFLNTMCKHNLIKKEKDRYSVVK